MQAALVGLAGVIIGGLLGWLGGLMRERRAERVASLTRTERRRTELWELSLPAATKVQEIFYQAMRRTDFSWASEDVPSFDEVFDEWWGEQESPLRRNIALLPSREFRLALERAHEMAGNSGALVGLAGYARTTREAVNKVASFGFDAASAWLRDETSLDPSLLERLSDLDRAWHDIDEQYRIDYEEMRDPKGYGHSQSSGD